jgi:hypothetical protein
MKQLTEGAGQVNDVNSETTLYVLDDKIHDPNCTFQTFDPPINIHYKIQPE